jgi:uncharacterized protein (TIGR02285 family)
MVLAAIFPSSFAHADTPHITWLVVDWPPYMILKNGAAPKTAEDLGQGVIDQSMAAVIRQMPGYTHEFELLSLQRIWKHFEEGNSFCYAAAYKTPEREKWAYFLPSIPVQPMGVVVPRHRKWFPTDETGSVSLAALLRTQSLKGRLEATRSYGPVVDQLLSQSPNVLPRDLVAKMGSLLRPLAHGRFDYTLEYPIVVEYALQQAPFKDELEVLGLSEASEMPTAYIACTRNPWGKQVTLDVDNAIRKASASKEIRKIYDPWLPKATRKKFSPSINEFFDRRMHTAYPPDP